MEDRIGCERFERLLEEASDLLKEKDKQEIRRGDQAVSKGDGKRMVSGEWMEREGSLRRRR